MDFLTGIVSQAICAVFKKAYDGIKNLYYLSRDVQELQSLLDSVEARKKDIDDLLERERKVPLNAVKDWLAKVERARTSVEAIRSGHHLHNRCSIVGCCPDCIFRFKLSQRVRDCKSTISGLLGEYESFNGQFGQIPLISRSEFIPVADVVGAAIQAAQRKIEDWLIGDNACRVVGVHGMPGVGKTTLLKLINNSQKVQTAFAIVIWATISQNLKHKEVLTRIVTDRLRLELPRDSSVGALRAEIYEFLKEKRFLVILDDVWDKLELEEDLGVPFKGRRGKIILSTRSMEVTRGMHADQTIKVEPLTSEEGWHLFRSRAFSDDEKLKNVPPTTCEIAERVAEQCGGLPLAINVVAAAMPAMDDPSAWGFALRQLQNVDPTFYDTHPNIDRQLFQCLRWSFDALAPHHLKVCFLTCSFYAEDVLIPHNELITKWIAEELVVGSEDDYLYDRGLDFIKILRDRCMVETTEFKIYGSINYVRVHDVVRDFAIRIAEEEENFLVRAGQNVETFPTERETQFCKRMSLSRANISSLPPNFSGTNLVSLALDCNDRLEEIPESFFQNLPSLKTLDLQLANIKSLPTSVGLLKQLVFLDLSGTDIDELPESLGNLTALSFLRLIGCRQLKYLPPTISDLKCLRVFLLIDCGKLTSVPVQISQITCLEKLDFVKSGVFVGEMGLNEELQERKEMCLKDLVNFRRLRELGLQIKSPIGNGVIGVWRKMRILRLYCGCGNQKNLPEDMVAMQELEKFHLSGCGVVRLPDWISDFKSLKVLSFFRCKQLKEICEVERLPRLIALSIESCDEVKDLGKRFGKAGSFPMLERLFLANLPSLESLVKIGVDGNGELEEGALPGLKMLKVINCQQLKRLPLGMERLRLEKIEGSEEWWREMAFENDNIKRYFENLYVEL